MLPLADGFPLQHPTGQGRTNHARETDGWQGISNITQYMELSHDRVCQGGIWSGAGMKVLGTGNPRENPPTNGIVRHDSHMRKCEGGPTGSLIRVVFFHFLEIREPRPCLVARFTRRRVVAPVLQLNTVVGDILKSSLGPVGVVHYLPEMWILRGDSSPFILQPFHEVRNGFWPRLMSPHPAIQFVPKLSYRVVVGLWAGQSNRRTLLSAYHCIVALETWHLALSPWKVHAQKANNRSALALVYGATTTARSWSWATNAALCRSGLRLVEGVFGIAAMSFVFGALSPRTGADGEVQSRQARLHCCEKFAGDSLMAILIATDSGIAVYGRVTHTSAIFGLPRSFIERCAAAKGANLPLVVAWVGLAKRAKQHSPSDGFSSWDPSSPDDGAALECRGGRNGNTQRKPADKRHRPARFPHAKIRDEPARDRTRIALVGGERPSHCATAAPRITFKKRYASVCIFQFLHFSLKHVFKIVKLAQTISPESLIVARYRRRDCTPVQCLARRGDERVDAHVSIAPSAPTHLGPRSAKFLQHRPLTSLHCPNLPCLMDNDYSNSTNWKCADYCVRGWMKDIVYQRTAQTREELLARISSYNIQRQPCAAT
ncbi:hypothetical protein PR048_028901 [Dryococelus australis]|uniref:Uncharacterized protein n=1 Tax=Dryococelus australis TaxID=614101 RepID=A0ABQ9GEI1_9NEOP|nr:hypothetical protein PR048_028901 [Dryococelus australis]